MFNFFKNWFGKGGDTAVVDAPEIVAIEAEASPVSEPAPDPAESRPASAPPKDSVRLTLGSVLTHLPAELRGRITQGTNVVLQVNAQICIPVESIVSQLGTGSVKISFGELRKLAPQGTFSRLSDRDGVLVPLPMAEIFPQIDPSLFQRRPVQRLEVPDEISGPFGNKGQGLVISRETKPTPAPVTPPPRNNVPAVPPIEDIQPIAFKLPGAKEAPVFRGFTPNPIGVGDQAPVAQTHQSAAPAASMTLQLAELAQAWPDAVRAEIVQNNMTASKVVLPEKLIEQGLRLGKVAFTWRELRSWVQPAKLCGISINDATVLELPLKLLAPLFLAKQNAARPVKKAVDEKVEAIPSLFFASAPPPEPERLVEKTLEDTNYYVWKDNDDSPDEVDLTQRAGKALPTKVPDTAFLRRYATPNEIVSKAAALDGVAGVLIALPDGLLVASRIPSNLNADTLAAFLPQIFGRVSQSTKELRMGDLNNLNFTVGNTPWKIFRVGSIFFAAFGRSGEPLPTQQLAGLAAELDRKPR